MERDIFQDHMPNNVCFGCGRLNPDGLQIESYWEDDQAVCVWTPERKYHGWETVVNGGILATVIDCHCMGTALAHAYRSEGRPMGRDPIYRYATSEITVRYLRPTPIDRPVVLRATVVDVHGRRTRLTCQVTSDGEKTAEAEVVGVRVLEGPPQEGSPFQ